MVCVGGGGAVAPASGAAAQVARHSSGSCSLMSQPRRLRARNAPWVQTRQRNPSNFGSNIQPRPRGIPSDRASIGSGSRGVTLAGAYVMTSRVPSRVGMLAANGLQTSVLAGAGTGRHEGRPSSVKMPA